MTFEGMVVHYNHGWVKRWVGAVAICLGRHVFTDRAALSDHVLAHEYCHVAQYEVYGFLGYLARWFYWTWKVGYYRNPFEEQARRYADWAVPPFYPAPGDYPGLYWLDVPPFEEQGELTHMEQATLWDPY